MTLYAAVGLAFPLQPTPPNGFQYSLPALTVTGTELSVTLQRSDPGFATGCPLTPGTPAVFVNGTLVRNATEATVEDCFVQVRARRESGTKGRV